MKNISPRLIISSVLNEAPRRPSTWCQTEHPQWCLYWCCRPFWGWWYWPPTPSCLTHVGTIPPPVSAHFCRAWHFFSKSQSWAALRSCWRSPGRRSSRGRSSCRGWSLLAGRGSTSCTSVSVPRTYCARLWEDSARFYFIRLALPDILTSSIRLPGRVMRHLNISSYDQMRPYERSALEFNSSWLRRPGNKANLSLHGRFYRRSVTWASVSAAVGCSSCSTCRRLPTLQRCYRSVKVLGTHITKEKGEVVGDTDTGNMMKLYFCFSFSGFAWQT